MQKTKEGKKPSKARHIFRKLIRRCCYLLGTFLALYIGGWLMLVHPIRDIYDGWCEGVLGVRRLFGDAMKCLFAGTVGGTFWSVGYIIGNIFREYDEDGWIVR